MSEFSAHVSCVEIFVRDFDNDDAPFRTINMVGFDADGRQVRALFYVPAGYVPVVTLGEDAQ